MKLNILLTWLLIFLVYSLSVNKETTMYGLLFSKLITEAVIIDFLILSQLYKLFSVRKVDNSSKVNAHNQIYEEKNSHNIHWYWSEQFFINIYKGNKKKKKLQKVKKNSVKMSLTWWKLTYFIRQKNPSNCKLKWFITPEK